MKATLESTEKIVQFNGVPCRIWEGHTEGGVPFHAYIVRVAVADKLRSAGDHAVFERELQEMRKPSADVEAIPMRMIL